MDTGPAPHNALSNSHRLTVRTCQSNSGIVKRAGPAQITMQRLSDCKSFHTRLIGGFL